MHLARPVSGGDWPQLHFYRIYRWMAHIATPNGAHWWINGTKIKKRKRKMNATMGMRRRHTYDNSSSSNRNSPQWITVWWMKCSPNHWPNRNRANQTAEKKTVAAPTGCQRALIQTVWKLDCSRRHLEIGELVRRTSGDVILFNSTFTIPEQWHFVQRIASRHRFQVSSAAASFPRRDRIRRRQPSGRSASTTIGSAVILAATKA